MVRPNKGVDHVDGLDGDPESKHRAKVVLSTISGQMPVWQASEALCVGPTQFAHIREQLLHGAVEAMRPKRVGRPPKVSTRTEAEFRALEQRIAELERVNALLRAQVELGKLSSSALPERSKRTRRSWRLLRTP